MYPLLFQGVGFADTILRSTDERSWSAIQSDDAIAQQSVHAAVGRLGFFAVGQSPVGATAPPSRSTGTRNGSIVVAIRRGAGPARGGLVPPTTTAASASVSPTPARRRSLEGLSEGVTRGVGLYTRPRSASRRPWACAESRPENP